MSRKSGETWGIQHNVPKSAATEISGWARTNMTRANPSLRLEKTTSVGMTHWKGDKSREQEPLVVTLRHPEGPRFYQQAEGSGAECNGFPHIHSVDSSVVHASLTSPSHTKYS